MKLKLWEVVLLILLIITLGLIFSVANKESPYRQAALVLDAGAYTLKLEVADTDAERELGLSGRTGLDQNSGLLFVFDRPGNYGFWMKDMLFPIDIAWLDKDRRVVHIERGVSPATYPTVFFPQANSTYVLEVNAGFLALHQINIGDVLEIKAN